MPSLHPLALALAFPLATGLASTAHAETLADAWAQALSTHPLLRAEQARGTAAQHALQAAQAAAQPGVTVEAGYSALDHAPAMRAELLSQQLQLPVAQRNSASAKASATWPLYTGGRIEAGIAAATASLQATQAQLDIHRQDLKLQVAQAYAEVQRAEQAEVLAQAHVLRLAGHRQDVANLQQQGMAGRNDGLAADLALAEATQQRLQATQALDLARAGYNRLLQRPLDQPTTLAALSDANLDEALPALSDRTLARLGEKVAVDRQIEQLAQQAAATRAEARPQLALNGGYGHAENRYQVHPGQWFVGIGLRWQAFDGGTVDHRAEAIDAQAAALRAQRDELVSSLQLRLRRAWLNLQAALQRRAVAQAAVAQADENLRIVGDRYSLGLATHTEVLDAEAMRTASQSRLLDGRFDALLAHWQLLHACGAL